ncbi:MAG TPA: hypothetical protein VGW40_12760 [Allosphingosinicella sp.]|nr:hypothetical protein [Allosphingosinicella sp.]
MDSFGMASAWSLGLRFVGQRPAGHALILIGIGVLAPFLLEVAVTGGPVDSVAPAMPGRAELGARLAPAWPLLLVTAAGYWLQTGSYFASWRLGFGAARSSLGGAILYGLVAGLLATIVVAIVAIVAMFGAGRFWSPDAVILGALILLLPLSLVCALFYTLMATLVAAAAALLLFAAMAFGTVVGDVGFAATMVGGRGDIVVLLLVVCGVMMWLAARLSCATSAMAERRSLNLLAALRDSWRLTWEEQWAILRYLALIGFALALVILGAGLAVGAGATNFLPQMAGPTQQAGAVALRLALAIPFAFLAVMVPAGIYRELTRADMSAEIFA